LVEWYGLVPIFANEVLSRDSEDVHGDCMGGYPFSLYFLWFLFMALWVRDWFPFDGGLNCFLEARDSAFFIGVAGS